MEEKKKLLVVYRRGTKECAEALLARLEGRAGLEAEIWNEPDYLDAKAAMTGGEYVLFLGDGMAFDREGVTIPSRFEQQGMRYGWTGRRAGIFATERPLDSKKKIKAFLEYLRAAFPEIGEEELAAVAEENMLAWGESLKAVVNPFAMVLDSMFKKPVSSAGTITALGRLQYKAAVTAFLRDGLDDFLSIN